MNRAKSESEPLTITDEPGMSERFQRGLQRALNTPHKPHAPTRKAKEQPVTKPRVRRSKTQP
jgi:hypothetical protein